MSIELVAVILHRMDHTKDVLDLSDDLTGIAGKARTTLASQIATNLGDSRAQRHTFDATAARVVDLAATRILEQPNDTACFIAATRVIAEHLYRSLVANATVGDLLASLFSVDGGPPQLALLKMQSETGYVQQVLGSSDTGDRRFEIDAATILTSGILHKCAFVLPSAARSVGHDLTVLDQQSGGGDHEGPIAAFFLKAFLECAVPPTPRELSRNFLKETRKFVGAHSELGSQANRDGIISAAKVSIASPEVAIEAFARDHIPVEALRAPYLEALRVGGVSADVFVPELPQQRSVRRLVLESDGVRIEIEPERYVPEIRSLNDGTLPAGTVLFEIERFGGARQFVLRTATLTEVGSR